MDGTVSRRRALTTGLGIGTLSWLTVGPLMRTGVAAYRLLTGGSVGTATMDAFGATVGLGLFFSLWGFMFTLGVPTIASVGMAFWLLDYEERSGREKRESNYQFE